VVTDDGISTDVSFEHELNALFPIEVNWDGEAKTSVVIPLQPEKALFPIDWRAEGNSNVTMLRHCSNALTPMEVKNDGDKMPNEAILLQPLKAKSSMVVTEPGNETDNKPVHPRKA
jgi:hypothetical protein